MTSMSEDRKRKLQNVIKLPDLPDNERVQLLQFLADHYQAFGLDPGKRSETSLVEMVIDTGNAKPLRQPVRHMPFAV